MGKNRVKYAPVWILIIGCLAYLAAKWTDLSLPFFWDELGVYGPGVLYMLDNGPGLLPSALDPELSRGHPLLFYFLFAVYSKLFGYSLFKIHLLAIAIFFTLVGVTYRVGEKVLNRWWGMFAGGILLVSPNIFASSAMVLPEILVSLFTLLSLFAAYQKKWGQYMVWGSLLLFTKESGIVVPMAVFGYILLFEKNQKIRLLLYSLIPIGAFILFLVIQRFQNGWFLFPYHTSLISFDWETIWRKVQMLWEALFIEQGRIGWTIILGTGIILGARKKIHIWHQLTGIFVMGYLLFFLINFFMDRYLTLLFPLIAIGLGASIWEISQLFPAKWRRLVSISLGVIMLLLPLFFFSTNKFKYDQDVNFRNIVAIQKETTTFIENEIDPQKTVFANFPLYNGLLDPRFGYRKNPYHIKPVIRMSESPDYIAIFRPGDIPPHQTDSMTVIFERKSGFIEVNVWGGE